MALKKPSSNFVMLTWLTILLATIVYAIFYSPDKNDSGLYQQFDVRYIDDSNNPLTLDQVTKLPNSAYQNEAFKLHSPEGLDFSMWYKISVAQHAQLNEAFTITVDNPTLDVIHFYVVNNEKTWFSKLLGDQQQTQYALDHVAPKISLFGGISSNTDIYIQIKTKGSVTTPILIESITDSQFRNSLQLIVLGALCGIGLIMIIYNYFMYRGVGEPSFLYYIFYVASTVTTISMINGFTFFIVPESVAIWANQYLIIPVHFLAIAFGIRFAIEFLRFDSIKPGFVNVGIKFANVMFIIAAISIYIPEHIMLPVFMVCMVSTYLYLMALMFMVLKSKIVWVRYYIVSWIPLFAGGMISVFAFGGLINYNFVTRNASLLGMLAEICIMAIAILDRFRANQVDREYRMNHDLATGLPNQMLLETAIKSLGQSKTPMSLMIFDIPQGKDLIPALGVESANKFFLQLFKNIEANVANLKGAYTFAVDDNGNKYHVVRIDESRFAALFVEALTDIELEQNVQTIQEAVSIIVNLNGVTMSVSSIAGVAKFPEDTHLPERLLSMSVQALIAGRQLDKKWARFDEKRNTDIQQRFRLAADLQTAIEQDDLELYHQAQIDIKQNRVYGSELLLRWVHHREGFIDPSLIIDIAEETGVIHQLTEWVIEKGFEQHSKLKKLGFNLNISINISGKDFSDNGLVAHIMTSAARFEIAPNTVTFEVTESATAEDPEQAKATLSELYNLGFKIAIDDFGTGYSSLDYLSQLPFHELKIDRCFMNIDTSERNRTITEVTLSLAKKLGVNAVAEGIENESVLALLKEFDCPVGQGYLFAKPKPFIEHMRWLQQIQKQNKDLMLDNPPVKQ